MKEKKKNRIIGARRGDIILRVQTTKFYCIPKRDDIYSLIEDWFYQHDMHAHHAAREYHEIGYSEIVNSVESIDYKTYEAELQEKEQRKKNLKEKR